jgi:predicted transcriptional regulator
VITGDKILNALIDSLSIKDLEELLSQKKKAIKPALKSMTDKELMLQDFEKRFSKTHNPPINI